MLTSPSVQSSLRILQLEPIGAIDTMAANINAAQAALANAINSLTPAQFSAFSASLAAAGVQTTAPVAAGAITQGSALAQPVAPLQTINPNPNVPGNQAGAGRMKPLNAFITYRSQFHTSNK